MHGKGFDPLHFSNGKVTTAESANTDTSEHCGAGINVATLDWCLREWQTGWRIIVVEFTAKDIAAIPTTTDGKFRLHRCKMVGEKDLTKLGLVKSAEKALREMEGDHA